MPAAVATSQATARVYIGTLSGAARTMAVTICDCAGVDWLIGNGDPDRAGVRRHRGSTISSRADVHRHCGSADLVIGNHFWDVGRCPRRLRRCTPGCWNEGFDRAIAYSGCCSADTTIGRDIFPCGSRDRNVANWFRPGVNSGLGISADDLN